MTLADALIPLHVLRAHATPGGDDEVARLLLLHPERLPGRWAPRVFYTRVYWLHRLARRHPSDGGMQQQAFQALEYPPPDDVDWDLVGRLVDAAGRSAMRGARMGVAFEVPVGWEIRVDEPHRVLCTPLEEALLPVDELTNALGIYARDTPAPFHEWVAALLYRRGVREAAVSIDLPGRAVIGCDWTDGVADVYSVFVRRDDARAWEIEASSSPARAGTPLPPEELEALARAVLASARWPR